MESASSTNDHTVIDEQKIAYDWEQGAWSVLKQMMKEPNFLIQHHIQSFNEFLDKGLKNVIEQFNPISLNYEFVRKQQFYRFKIDSPLVSQVDSNEWVEFQDTAEIFRFFKEHFSLIHKQATNMNLSNSVASCNEKEKALDDEFKEFVAQHMEFQTFEVNKHRYDVELEVIFHSLTPPTIYENNGSQKLMYPNEARQRSCTYASTICVNIHYKVRERHGMGLKEIRESPVRIIPKVNCGKLPIMLGSKSCLLSNKTGIPRINFEECQHDEGGYFIVNGTEKVIIGQERQAENKIYVFRNSKAQSKYSHICEIKSLPYKKILTPKSIKVQITNKDTIYGRNIKVSIPHIKQDVPLFVVFKALGVVKDYDIVNYILFGVSKDNWKDYTQFLLASLEEASTIRTEEEAKTYLCKYVSMMGYERDQSEKDRRMLYLNDIIKNDFLPHVGDSYTRKAYFLGFMVKRLLDVFLNKVDADDRDSYVNKRIDTTGVLFANLFRQYYTKLVKDMKTNINKEYINGSWRSTKQFENIINSTNIHKIIKYSTITTGLKFALATGNWGIKNNNNKQGIAQVLSRLTFNSTLSHLRRINTPMEKTSKLVAPRKLHGTQFMYICGAETPEGGPVGVVKNLALSCHITSYSDMEPLMDIIRNQRVLDISTVSPEELFGTTMILVNGNWTYNTKYPKTLVDTLVGLRRKGILHLHTSIVWRMNDNRIELYTDAGRCIRPLYIVENNQFAITNDIVEKIKRGTYTWSNLLVGSLSDTQTTQSKDLENGVIEYIDVQEEDTLMIAIHPDKLKENGTKVISYEYTHAEIHPSFLQGVLASIIPFSDHNQSPRNTYQSAMGKQAMGIYATNYRYRMDTVAHVLRYPQRPIVDSRVLKYLSSNDLPAGINAIVAIACFSGYNQEDSIIMNRSATNRGLFMSDHYRTTKDEEKKRQSTSIKMQEKFVKPNLKTTLGTVGNNYSKLNDDGFPTENTYLRENDAVIGKIHPIFSKKKDDKELYRCCSTIIKQGDEGFVDKVIESRNGDGYKFVKVRIRSSREPTVGDKHACYTPDHEVLTANRGWIAISDVSLDDTMVSMDPKTGVLELVQPTAIQSYAYDGELYRVDSPLVHLQVTPNHRMYVIPLDKDETMTFTFYQARDMYHRPAMYQNNVLNEYEGVSEEVYTSLAEHRVLCPEVFQLSSSQARMLLADAYPSLDVVIQLEKEHADFYTTLALLAGWSFKMEDSPVAEDSPQITPRWDVYINRTEHYPHVNTHTSHLLYSDQYVPYKGPVHCCTVPTGILYVRRKGVPVWCGNSRHGQKGTVGMIYSQEDMPFTKDGIRPDLIMNPHAVPSRMTIAQVIECLMGKTGVNLGMFGDGTAFTRFSEKKLGDLLQELGFQRHCDEVMYNGRTGEMLKVPIFIGPTYYQRLKHMVEDKMHCLTLDHEVLTKEGWKFYGDLRETDELATLNQKTHNLEYQVPTAIHHYPETETKLYTIRNSSIDLSVTENHRMYVYYEGIYRFMYAHELVGKAVSYVGENQQSLTFDPTRRDHTLCVEPFTGPVFCVSVPNEVFMVRRNGKMVWTGNSRSTGPNVILTRQPSEGRSNDGGLRLGEMERDCILSHGACQFLKESMMDRSDHFQMYCCEQCGLVAVVNREQNIYECKNCNNHTAFAEIRLPYAMKLFIQELETMSIAPRFVTKHSL